MKVFTGIAAEKHVLVEKPSADTAEETRRMFEFANQKGLGLLEAFHYRQTQLTSWLELTTLQVPSCYTARQRYNLIVASRGL
jgi:hypothetical protein